MLVESAQAMQALGSRIAGVLVPGDVLILTGDLGAGKTTFAQGVAKGLGITEIVTSPTFVMSKEYTVGALTLIHLDVYRISHPDELVDLWSVENAGTAITLVEWGGPWAAAFGDRVVELRFSPEHEVDLRTISDQGKVIVDRIVPVLA